MRTRRVHQFTIGDRLRKAREEAGYDQREFADKSGISRGTIGAYELGKSAPKLPYVAIWANVTDTDYDWLLTGEDVREPDYRSTEGDDNDPVEPETVVATAAEISGSPANLPRKAPQAGWGPVD